MYNVKVRFGYPSINLDRICFVHTQQRIPLYLQWPDTATVSTVGVNDTMIRFFQARYI